MKFRDVFFEDAQEQIRKLKDKQREVTKSVNDKIRDIKKREADKKREEND
jgi:hypothetical protein